VNFSLHTIIKAGGTMNVEGKDNSEETKTQSSLLHPLFDSRFLNKHAGNIINDPRIAIIELVANCWDAGATNVHIMWPTKPETHFEIIDNGIGMTEEEFGSIWYKFDYNRLKSQGNKVIIPGSEKIERKVFGRNGKGRHSLFCFSREYKVETWKNGTKSIFNVFQNPDSSFPYDMNLKNKVLFEGHGTKISCEFDPYVLNNKEQLEVEDIQELVGTKFILDPSLFKVYVNDVLIDPIDILENSQEYECPVPGFGIAKINVIDSMNPGRTSKQHGVAWWVNRRLVGEPSWEDITTGRYLDARKKVGKRYTIIVRADILEDEVKEDWTGFNDNEKVRAIKKTINGYILEKVADLFKDIHHTEKMKILKKQKPALKQLSKSSRYEVGSFIDELHKRCPTLNQQNLEDVINVFVKMEASKSGYKLLTQLASLSPDDIDACSNVLDEWDIMDAKTVLDLLGDRLQLIEKLEELVEDDKTDELKDLQPLFDHGLWMFGHEFESVEFTSNKALSTVIRNYFDKKNIKDLKNSRKRPDFVVLPESTIRSFSKNRYDDSTGDVCGIHKVLIVELKRGGHIICDEDLHQAQYYAKELRKAGRIESNTIINCFVLGTKVELGCEFSEIGEQKQIKLHPKSYSSILQNAHARTFNLMQEIKKNKGIDEFIDEEVDEVFKQKDIDDF
jgi:hypothetical protein